MLKLNNVHNQHEHTEEKMKNIVGRNVDKGSYDETVAAREEPVSVTDEIVWLGFDDEATEEKCGADELNMGDVECIEERRFGKKKMTFSMCDFLDIIVVQKEIRVADYLYMFSITKISAVQI